MRNCSPSPSSYSFTTTSEHRHRTHNRIERMRLAPAGQDRFVPNTTSIIRASGGLAPTHRLLDSGVSPAAIAWGVHSGALIRVRKGWYCLPSTPIEHQQAARIGGRLTATSAAQQVGVWVPERPALHVSVRPNACRLRDRDDFRRRLTVVTGRPVVVHWTDDSMGSDPFVRPVAGWLRDAMLTMPIDVAVAMADSAIHTGQIDHLDWEELRASLPSRLSQPLAVVDGVPDSGTESIVRFDLLRVGVHSRSRAVVVDGKEVDLLVGDRLVVDIDSDAHHGSRQQRKRDLKRDAELAALGYIVLRFDYVHVMHDIGLVRRAVLAKVLAGEHLWPSWR